MEKGHTRSLLTLLICLLLFLTSCNSSASSTTSQGAQSGAQQSTRQPFTYVAIGASDTFGIGANDPYTENWPTDLATQLGKNVHLINLGIPEITVHDALTAELPVALDAHPDLITIWLAVNDLATNVPVDSYAHDLDYLLSQLQAKSPHVQIAVANVPDLTLVPYFSTYDQQTLRQQVASYNSAIAGIVGGHHAVLVDLSRFDLKDFPQYISNDGLHPSTAGYLALAALFYAALQKAGF
jgi:lysophospholipase L1-like esterase